MPFISSRQARHGVERTESDRIRWEEHSSKLSRKMGDDGLRRAAYSTSDAPWMRLSTLFAFVRPTESLSSTQGTLKVGADEHPPDRLSQASLICAC